MDRDALFQSGMDLELPSTTRKEDTSYIGSFVSDDDRKDHLVVKNGVRCAGTHLIIELYEAKHLDDIGHIDRALRACVKAAGATLLHIHLHHFEPNGGVSGVAVLAESHISIHTWPECGYAALDVFMCGDTSPEKCVPVLKKAFCGEARRGRDAVARQGHLNRHGPGASGCRRRVRRGSPAPRSLSGAPRPPRPHHPAQGRSARTSRSCLPGPLPNPSRRIAPPC